MVLRVTAAPVDSRREEPMIHRLISGSAATVVLVGGLVLATEAPASAATCTSPVVVYHTPLTYAGSTYGYVDLEYSTACHSARAHVHSIYVSHPGDSHGLVGSINRVNSTAVQRCTAVEGAQDCRTAWLYDLDPYKATAHGDVDLYPTGGYHDAVGTTPAY
jgi:hypothetical protein